MGFTIEVVEKFCNTELIPEYCGKDPKKFFPILHKEEGISRRNLRVLLHSSGFCHRKKIKGTYYDASGRPDVHWDLHNQFIEQMNTYKEHMIKLWRYPRHFPCVWLGMD